MYVCGSYARVTIANMYFEGFRDKGHFQRDLYIKVELQDGGLG